MVETGRALIARPNCVGNLDIPRLFPVLYGQSVFHFQRGELDVAYRVAQDLLWQAQHRAEVAAQVTGHRMIGSALCQKGKFAESRDAFEAALFSGRSRAR